MTTLHLGVLDQPYHVWKNGKRTSKSTGETTYGVAEILESEYGVMQAFFDAHGEDIAHDMEDGISASLNALMEGHVVKDPFGEAMSKTQHRFNQFISSQEDERVGIEGVPTEAALKGVNHRLKHPYAKANPRRPSFKDTGLYMDSFRAWGSGWLK